MDLNRRITAIPPSVTLSITSKAKALLQAGEDVCSFGAGEPDFDTPEHIKKAAAKALADGCTKYAPTAGLPALREAVAEKLQSDNGLTFDPQQIIVSDGAKHSLFNVIMTICSEGDEVIIPTPYWLSYPEMVRVAGARPVFVASTEANGFKVTPDQLEKAITGKTKAVIINSPSNPTGSVYSEKELSQLAQVLVKHDLYVISDEIYEKILYDGVSHKSIASVSDELFKKTIVVNGFSKAYSMTGWRIGYIGAPFEITKPMTALQSHSTSGATTFAQHGAIVALTGPQDCVADMVAAFSERREYLHKRLTDIKGVDCPKPEGAFYLFPNIGELGLDSLAFSERLLNEHKVAVVPGKPFGHDENIRLSYACSMDNIREGMDRLETFIASL